MYTDAWADIQFRIFFFFLILVHNKWYPKGLKKLSLFQLFLSGSILHIRT